MGVRLCNYFVRSVRDTGFLFFPGTLLTYAENTIGQNRSFPPRGRVPHLKIDGCQALDDRGGPETVAGDALAMTLCCSAERHLAKKESDVCQNELAQIHFRLHTQLLA